ncbi:MAG: hypothetical protein V1900_04045 [Candidatus Aenigmatarchaeota archaeon]
MILGMPLAIWFGIITVISLFITAYFGIAMYIFKKPVFKQHKIFAFITVILAVVHSILAAMLWFFQIVI